jgi:hypothetical protein
MKKQAPREHEHVDSFHKLANLEVYVDMEAILQPTQTQQVEETLQKIQTHQYFHKLIVKVPKMGVYSKRSSS